MKTSIKKILSSLQFNAMILILLTLLTGAVMLSSMATYARMQNVVQQEQLVKKMLTLGREDLAFSKIEIAGIMNQLPILIDNLSHDAFYEFINNLIIMDSKKRVDLSKVLLERNTALDTAANRYFNSDSDVTAKRNGLRSAVDDYLLALYPVATLQNAVLYEYFIVILIGFSLILLWTFIVILVAKHASKTILGDIHTLIQQDTVSRTPAKYNTTEINTVALKLRHQGGDILASSKQDHVTQLPNYDGVKSGFEQRASKSKNANPFVCIFEIDNYSKLVNHYPQSVIDPVLIKIASIMKLHKLLNDQVGRIDDSLFIAIFMRPDKQTALGDCDHIRMMIEDNRFKLPHNSFPITLSGGFAAKTASQTLDDAVKNAKEYLKIAQSRGGNMVAELKDHTKIL